MSIGVLRKKQAERGFRSLLPRRKRPVVLSGIFLKRIDEGLSRNNAYTRKGTCSASSHSRSRPGRRKEQQLLTIACHGGHGNLASRFGRTYSSRMPAHSTSIGRPDSLAVFNPFLNYDFDVGQGFLNRQAVGSASRQFRHLRDKGVVLLAPMENDFILRHGIQASYPQHLRHHVAIRQRQRAGRCGR